VFSKQEQKVLIPTESVNRVVLKPDRIRTDNRYKNQFRTSRHKTHTSHGWIGNKCNATWMRHATAVTVCGPWPVIQTRTC